MNAAQEFTEVASFIKDIPSPRRVALDGAEDRSGEREFTHWALAPVGLHTFGAHWAPRAKTPAAKRHSFALAMGARSWEDLTAAEQAAAQAVRLYVPAAPWVRDALTVAGFGLRNPSRETVEKIVGYRPRFCHPHEGVAWEVICGVEA